MLIRVIRTSTFLVEEISSNNICTNITGVISAFRRKYKDP